MPAGQPTKYRPEYCDKVREWGVLGKSRAWMCATLGIAKRTIDLWEQAHPEFLSAMEEARALTQKWWEDAGQSGMLQKSIDSGIWSRSMAARFPDDWREKSETTINGSLQIVTKEQRDAAIAAAIRAES
jgi:hypothetical protein